MSHGSFVKRLPLLIPYWASDVALWLAVALLAVGSWWFYVTVFRPPQPQWLELDVQDANEVTRGASVYFLGVPVGYVEQVKLNGAQVEMLIKTEPDTPTIPREVAVSINASGMSGGKTIEIVPKDKDALVDAVARTTNKRQARRYEAETPTKFGELLKYQVQSAEDLKGAMQNIASFLDQPELKVETTGVASIEDAQSPTALHEYYRYSEELVATANRVNNWLGGARNRYASNREAIRSGIVGTEEGIANMGNAMGSLRKAISPERANRFTTRLATELESTQQRLHLTNDNIETQLVRTEAGLLKVQVWHDAWSPPNQAPLPYFGDAAAWLEGPARYLQQHPTAIEDALMRTHCRLCQFNNKVVDINRKIDK